MTRKYLFFILTISLLVLPTALLPVAAAEGEIEDGFEFVWNADTDIILYFPNDPTASPLLSVYDGDNTQLDALETQFEQNAWRDVDVYMVENGPREGLLAVRLTITWSTSSEAISFGEWRTEQLLAGRSYSPGGVDVNFGLGLNQATNNDSGNVVVDVLPDADALEGDVSRSSTDTGGSQYLQYKNGTDIDVAGSLIVDFADYNYSSAKWIDLTGLRMDGAGNATIDITYAYQNGTLATSQTNVFTTDQYLSAEDTIVKLPEPSAIADNLGNKATYVAKINFTALELDEFRLFDFASEDYDLEGSDYVFDNDIPALGLNAISAFSTWAQSNSAKLKSFSVKNTASKVTQTARGFVSVKASAIKAATAATGTKIKDVVDHEVVKARDKMSTPGTLSNNLYSAMKTTYDNGEKNAQAMAREARKHLKAVQVTVGVKAEAFGEKVDHAKDMTKETIAGIAKSGGKAVSGATDWGKGIFDSGKDGLGRLKDEGASLFSKMSDGIFSIGDDAKKIIIAVVAVAVLAGALLLYRKD